MFRNKFNKISEDLHTENYKALPWEIKDLGKWREY